MMRDDILAALEKSPEGLNIHQLVDVAYANYKNIPRPKSAYGVVRQVIQQLRDEGVDIPLLRRYRLGTHYTPSVCGSTHSGAGTGGASVARTHG